MTVYREVFVALETREAASAMKKHVEKLNEDLPQAKKIQIFYVAPEPNPFKSFPKDAQNRNRDWQQQSTFPNGGYNQQPGGFRGRGGMNGGMNRGGYQNTSMQMGNTGYNGQMNNMQRGGGGGMMNTNMNMNRGGFQGGFRGGRGGGGHNMMTGQMGTNFGMMGNMAGMAGLGGMTGMPMGMNMAMGMPMTGMAMPGVGFAGKTFIIKSCFEKNQTEKLFLGGFSAQPQLFNLQNMQQGQTPIQGQISPMGNPHGAKRPRPE